jgi:hypothetical protein
MKLTSPQSTESTNTNPLKYTTGLECNQMHAAHFFGLVSNVETKEQDARAEGKKNNEQDE